MQTDKAGKLIRKIQALYENLSDQGTMSSLERDLILSYLRELYEEISLSATGRSVAPRKAPEPLRQEYREEPVKAPEPPKPTPPPPPAEKPVPPVVQEDIVPVQPEPVSTPPVREMTPPSPPPPPEPKYTEPQGNHSAEPVPAYVATAPAPPTSNGEVDEEVLALFEFKQIGELSEKLQLSPLDRIEQGLGINERILIINELFKGDGILFNKTLKELDSMRSFEEARRYLITGVANQFKWGDRSRKSQATLFVQLVRRRFLPS